MPRELGQHQGPAPFWPCAGAATAPLGLAQLQPRAEGEGNPSCCSHLVLHRAHGRAGDTNGPGIPNK